MTRMLTNSEAMVCVNLGISAEEFLAAEGSGTQYAVNNELAGKSERLLKSHIGPFALPGGSELGAARNSETEALLTDAERQVCEQLGINQLEYLKAKTEKDGNDMAYVMIQALERG